MGSLNILHVFLSQLKTFALICLYSPDFAILVVLGNMTCLAFDIFLISHLLDVGDFPQNPVNVLVQ